MIRSRADLPDAVREAWPDLQVTPGPYGTGLINLTLKGRASDRDVIVQRVHPAFAPPVHEDIEAVTSHVARRGLVTPRLVPTTSGALCAVDEEGRPWRLLTFIAGSFSFDRLHTPTLVREAGRLVGVFHEALSDLRHDYRHVRPGIHDVAFRTRGLDAALDAHGDHALHAEVKRMRERLAQLEPLLLPVDVTPARHAHGDLKASNVLFDATERAMCLVDLDTLAMMAWPFELGDAIRSWCNPKREDEPGAALELELYAAAVEGYVAGAGSLALDERVWRLLPRGVLTIASELAMRFLTDALEERYFSFDPARFPSRGAHNLARAKGQLELATSIAQAQGQLEDFTARAFAAR
jgi:Ser/Thr protein kinase RdoA (MazF antagonist)